MTKSTYIVILISLWLVIAAATIIYAYVTYPNNFLTSTSAKEEYIKKNFATRIHSVPSLADSVVDWTACDSVHIRYSATLHSGRFRYIMGHYSAGTTIDVYDTNNATVAFYRPGERNPANQWSCELSFLPEREEVKLRCREIYECIAELVR